MLADGRARPLVLVLTAGNVNETDTGGELSLSDGAGARYSPCAFSPAWWDLVATGSPSFVRLGSDQVPHGASVVMWLLFAAPPADRASVAVGVGGFAGTLPAPVTARSTNAVTGTGVDLQGVMFMVSGACRARAFEPTSFLTRIQPGGLRVRPGDRRSTCERCVLPRRTRYP